MTARPFDKGVSLSRKNAEARARSADVERQRKDGKLAKRGTPREELSRMIEAERVSRKR